MTRNEVTMIMGILQVAYPRFYINLSPKQADLSVDLWTKMLADITAEQAVLAVNKIIAVSEWPPTISEVRKAVSETQYGKLKEPGEAWGEVTAAIRRFGYMREREALESMPVHTRKAVECMGWQTLCQSEELMADRAHFLKIYELLRNRSVENSQIPVFIKSEIARNIETNREKNKSIDTSDMEIHPTEKMSEILKKMIEMSEPDKNQTKTNESS